MVGGVFSMPSCFDSFICGRAAFTSKLSTFAFASGWTKVCSFRAILERLALGCWAVFSELAGR